jgi:signal transduction histidine kinase
MVAVLVMVAVTALIVAYFVLVASYDGPATLNDTDPGADWPLVIGSYISMLTGAFLVWMRPRNPLGFLLMLSVGFTTYTPLVVVVDRLAAVFGPTLWVRLLAWSGNWAWVLTFAGIVYMLLLFPEGKPLSHRWRWVGRAAGVVLAMILLATMFVPGPLEAAPKMDNPLGVGGLSSVPQGAIDGLALVVLAHIAAAVVSLFLRYRRSSGEERQQLKWVAYAAVVTINLVVFVSFVPSVPGARFVDGLTEVLVPVAIAIAVLRYRLFDIDVVISRTLVFGILATFITGVYVVVVVGLGSLVGGGGEPNLGLSILATGLVAVLFEPVRLRAQSWANRVVFGRRASPYQVLAGLTARLGETAADEDVLERLATLLGEGTGAVATVWLRIGDEFRPAASSHGVLADTSVPVGDEAGSVEDADLEVPVVHEEETLGLLSLKAARGQQITPNDERLVTDVAGNVGLILRHVRLNTELAARAEELQESRRRLVAVQDEERRRLERDLHDGAQQHVVAAAMQLNMARMIAEREGHNLVASQLGDLVELDQQAVEQLRTIARGIYPPLLEAEGLDAAIIGAARSLPIQVDLESDHPGRYPQDIEAAIYFCVTETIRDALRREATTVGISLTPREETIEVSVTDDATSSPGPQTLTLLIDRIAAGNGVLTNSDNRIHITLPARLTTVEAPV